MASDVVVADTYALIEMVSGNDAYKQYTEMELVTTDFILAEFYYYLLRTFGKTIAMSIFPPFARWSVEVSHETIITAVEYRFANKGESMSYTDCIGYTMAQALGIPFLTGDKAFKGKPGVLWVR